MNRQFDAQVELPSGTVAPDAWDEMRWLDCGMPTGV